MLCSFLASYSWTVDGNVLRIVTNDGSKPYPVKPMYMYSSVWDASYVNGGAWCGIFNGANSPYRT